MEMTFKEASRFYDTMVLDTCAITGYHPARGADGIEDGGAFAFSLQEKMNQGYPIVLPEPIIRELKNHRTPDRGEMQRIGGLIGCYKDMIQKENVLGIDEGEIHKDVERSFGKYAQYGVSKQDLSVFEYARTLQLGGIPTAIVSNDGGLQNVWREYTQEADIAPGQLGFLIRRGMARFELPF